MLRDASDYGMDGGILDGFTMDDIDLNTLRSYRIEYERHNPDHVWNGKDDKEFLRNLGAYALDRSTKREGLTTAGLLMFGKGLAIRERFDNIRMDYLDQTIKAVRSNMPIRGEIANALESMNGNAVAGLLASLKKRDGISTWGPEFDGLIFVEITFDLTGANEEDIYLMARFYCEGTPMASGGVTAGSVSPSATFVKALREKRDMWLNATFGEGDSELKSEVASCINIRLGERRVDMEVKMPAAVYAKLRDLHPDIATECLSVMFDQFQLSEHMSSGSAPAGAAVEAPAEAANLFGN